MLGRLGVRSLERSSNDKIEARGGFQKSIRPNVSIQNTLCRVITSQVIHRCQKNFSVYYEPCIHRLLRAYCIPTVKVYNDLTNKEITTRSTLNGRDFLRSRLCTPKYFFGLNILAELETEAKNLLAETG